MPHQSSAWPMSAMSREGGTVVTSCDSACASCARRFSFGVAPYTSLHVAYASHLPMQHHTRFRQLRC